MIPGEIETLDGDIELNVGRERVTVRVANSGDRPIQVGSHYHFYETNDALHFDREATRGFRLDIAAGTAVRFEPGQEAGRDVVSTRANSGCSAFRQGHGESEMSRIDRRAYAGCSVPPRATACARGHRAGHRVERDLTATATR